MPPSAEQAVLGIRPGARCWPALTHPHSTAWETAPQCTAVVFHQTLLNGRALVTEQLPPRKQQLYDTYGPTGSTPLIPDAQPATVSLVLGRTGGSASTPQQFVEIVNPNDFAVDVSGWGVSGDITANLTQGLLPSLLRVFCALGRPCATTGQSLLLDLRQLK